MKGLTFGIWAGMWMLGVTCHAATVIASYSGGANPTTMAGLGTTKWAAESGTTTNVISSSVLHEGRQTWMLQDPGFGTSELKNNLYYNVRPTNAQISAMVTNGFELSISLKIPGLDEVAGPAWTRDSNAALGFYFANPEDTTQRISFSISTGRNAQGQTLIAAAGNSTVLTLDPTFHLYTIRYVAGVASFHVDGVYQYDLTPAVTTSSAVNMLYWGDNNNATTAPAYGARMAYFESVQLLQTPEPSAAVTGMLGVVCLILMRRRRQSF